MRTESERGKDHVLVVGGGLAGLTAAVCLARAGKRVTLLEKASQVGGRAQTRRDGEFHINLGPHALYVAGEGSRVLRELGIAFRGGLPKASGGHAIYGGKKHVLPGGFVSLLSTGLLGLGEKLELARVLPAIGKWKPRDWEHRSVDEWLAAAAQKEPVRALLGGLVRLTTYANANAMMSAAVAISQIQMALAKNVFYIDGGWQTLVDGLARAAADAGVTLRSGVRVARLLGGDRAAGVEAENGETIAADAVVLAAAPGIASSLTSGSSASLTRFAAEAMPVRAACLDLELDRLPDPRSVFALGIDAPVYFSVHSAAARLAPDGKAVVHVAKYTTPTRPVQAARARAATGASGGGDDVATRSELEALVDLVQPGWRSVVVDARYLPKMTVAESLPTAASGGLGGRPRARVSEIANCYVAGDWVGEVGWLADASFASARDAARACIEDLARGGGRHAAA